MAKRTRLGLVASLVLTFHGAAAVAQQVPGPRIEVWGVNVNDEFDGIFARAFGCYSQIGLKRRAEAGITRPYRCNATSDAFLRLIIREKALGTPVETYLKSKGGICKELAAGKRRCVVEREVASTFHLGDPTKGDRLRTLFTLNVEVSETGDEIKTDIERYDFGPTEGRG